MIIQIVEKSFFKSHFEKSGEQDMKRNSQHIRTKLTDCSPLDQ